MGGGIGTCEQINTLAEVLLSEPVISHTQRSVDCRDLADHQAYPHGRPVATVLKLGKYLFRRIMRSHGKQHNNDNDPT